MPARDLMMIKTRQLRAAATNQQRVGSAARRAWEADIEALTPAEW
jgi:hypothetical protein